MSASSDPHTRSAPASPGGRPPVPGRPASVLPVLGLLGLPALLFALITWQVVSDGPLVRVDKRVSHDLVDPLRVYGGLADLGNVFVAVPVLVLVICYVARRGRAAGMYRWWLPPVAAAVAMVLVPVLVVPLKVLTDRPGPPIMGPGTGYYPSGHTATACVAYGAATLLLLPWLNRERARRALVAGCVLVNLGVGYGLVRRGYHWPLDVVASWCLCLILLTVLRMVLGRAGISRSSRRRSAGTPSSSSGPS